MSERRLAAIMFTDIAGYTVETQSSESRALELLDRHNALLRSIFSKFGGREIKTIGDSFLVEFDSALDAVNCAVEIQRTLRDYNSKEDRKINIRIGIHLGDIVRKQGDVFGDAVNIASRIQPLADVGGICVSQQVYDQVQNKIELPFEKLNHAELKNVKFPIEVYKLVVEDREDSPVNRLRIAVLPFVNMSPSRDDEYFADGLTEELIAELALVEGLSVISRTSVMHYRNSSKKIQEIGRELRVGTVLEGSVRKAGNKIRITAQLIDSANDDHLWADRYDRELSDIFAVQDEIAKSVAGALRSKLVPAKKHTSDLEAYNLYLQGRYFWNKRSREGGKKALELFEEAVKKDPAFAQAYSGIADCYSIMVDRGDMTAVEALSKAIEAATKAIHLDGTLAEAHTSLALPLLRNYEWERAEAEFKKAIELNPSYASAHQWYAHLLLDLGRDEEARREIAKATEADPLSPVILQNVSFYYDVIGQYRKAIEAVNRGLEIHPIPILYMTRAIVYGDSGDRENALKDIERFDSVDDSPSKKASLGFCYARLGMLDKAQLLVNETVELAKTTFFPSSSIAFLYAFLGNMDECFMWTFKAIEDRTFTLRLFLLDPKLTNVRADPRFREVLLKCRVPESVLAKWSH